MPITMQLTSESDSSKTHCNVNMLAHQLLAVAALLTAAQRSAAFTLPNQGKFLPFSVLRWLQQHFGNVCAAAAAAALAFRDTMVKVGPWWTEALSTWHCPTPAGSSNSSCDPCAEKAWCVPMTSFAAAELISSL